MTPLKFFISYSHADPEEVRLARFLCDGLVAAGHEPFIDVAMPVGTDWPREVDARIEWCDVMVVLLSAASTASRMVQSEVRKANARRSRDPSFRIYPVRLRALASLPYEFDGYLGTLQTAHWSGPDDSPRVLEAILLASQSGRPPSPEPVRVPPPAPGPPPIDRRTLIGAGLLAAVGAGILALFMRPAARPIGGATVAPPDAGAKGVAIPQIPASDVLEVAYRKVPPEATGTPTDLGLVFMLLARHAGQREFSPLPDGGLLASEVDDYMVFVQPESAGFLYVFQVDSSGQVEWLFPKNDLSAFSTGSNPVVAGQHFLIPEQDRRRAFYLDQVTGREHVYAVLSATRWEELESVLRRSREGKRPDPGGVGIPGIQMEGGREGIVQAPLALETRGIGGSREVSIPVTMSRGDVSHKLVLSGTVLLSKVGFLVVERMFGHVTKP